MMHAGRLMANTVPLSGLDGGGEQTDRKANDPGD